MKALERYVKKSKSGDPFKGDKAKDWKGPEGVKDSDQYADMSGKQVVSEDAGSEASGGGKKGAVGAKVFGKNGKKRPYMC